MKNLTRRILSIVLMFTMLAGNIPTGVFAEEILTPSEVQIVMEGPEEGAEEQTTTAVDEQTVDDHTGDEQTVEKSVDKAVEQGTDAKQPSGGPATFGILFLSKDYSYSFSGLNQTVTLDEILKENNISLSTNYNSVTVDSDAVELVRLSDNIQNNNCKNYSITAVGYFDDAVLTLSPANSKKGKVYEIHLSNPQGEDDGENEDDEEGEDARLVEGTLYYNDDLYLTGHIPGNGVIDVKPVEITSPDGHKVLKSYDITIYANEKQREKGKPWKPAGKKVTVHWRDDGFADAKELAVWHFAETASDDAGLDKNAKTANAVPDAVQIENVTAEDGWLTFDTDSFSIYAVTGIIETDITAGDGNTYHVTATFDSDSGIPEDAVLKVDEISTDSEAYQAYYAQSEELLGQMLDDAKIFDIQIVDKDDPETVYEPAEGSGVTVTITLKEKPEYYETATAHIVHIGEDGAEELANIAAAVDGGYEYTFTASSLSPVVVGYTVDFYYNGYSFSIYGESEIMLSELLSRLGINALDLREVTDIEFSDNSLVKVEREDRADGTPDWKLTSLKAFDTVETLAIELKDGQVIEVRVTDAQAPTTKAQLDAAANTGILINIEVQKPNGTVVGSFEIPNGQFKESSALLSYYRGYINSINNNNRIYGAYSIDNTIWGTKNDRDDDRRTESIVQLSSNDRIIIVLKDGPAENNARYIVSNNNVYRLDNDGLKNGYATTLLQTNPNIDEILNHNNKRYIVSEAFDKAIDEDKTPVDCTVYFGNGDLAGDATIPSGRVEDNLLFLNPSYYGSMVNGLFVRKNGADTQVRWVFKLGEQVYYYTGTNYIDTAAHRTTDILPNAVLLETGETIVAKMEPNYFISQGIIYKLSNNGTADGSATVEGFTEDAPVFVTSFRYNNHTYTVQSSEGTVTQEDIDNHIPASVSVPEPIITPSAPTKEVLNTQSDAWGEKNDSDDPYDKDWFWKTVSFDANTQSVNVTFQYFQKRYGSKLDFIFVVDETGTMGNRVPATQVGSNTYTETRYMWARYAMMKATQGILNGNKPNNGYQNRVYFILWAGTTARHSGFISSYDAAVNWFNNHPRIDGGTDHTVAMNAAISAAKTSSAAGRTPVVIYMSDFAGHSDNIGFTYRDELNKYALVYPVVIYPESATNSPGRRIYYTADKSHWKNMGDDPTSLITIFDEIIDDSVCHTDASMKIEDVVSDKLEAISSLDGNTLTWELNGGVSDGETLRLENGKVYTHTFTIPISTKNAVISGSMPTNGSATVKDSKQEYNRISSADSPLLKKPLILKNEKTGHDGDPISGTFAIYKRDGETETLLWRGTTDATTGEVTVPWAETDEEWTSENEGGAVAFIPGQTYILKELTPADGTVLPSGDWKISVSDDYVITAEIEKHVDGENEILNVGYYDGKMEIYDDIEPTVHYVLGDGATWDSESTDVGVNFNLTETHHTYTLTSAIPVKNGYTFIMWNTKQDGSGDNYAPGSTMEIARLSSTDTDIYLYAQWMEGTPICKIVDIYGESTGTEHIFPKLNEAVAYARQNGNGQAMSATNPVKIEMLVDYVIPDTDKVTLNQASDNIIITTAATAGGVYNFTPTFTAEQGRTDADSSSIAILQRGWNGSGTGSTALFYLNNASAKLRTADITLDGNGYTGRAVYVNNSDVCFTGGTTVRNFHVDERGSAVYVSNSGTHTIIDNSSGKDVIFRDCSVNGDNNYDGACINIQSGSVIINNSGSGTVLFERITGNASTDGGAIGIEGSGSLTVNNTGNGAIRFVDCRSGQGGGALETDRGTLTLNNTGTGTMEFLRCYNTNSYGGGAIYSGGSCSVVNNGTISFIGTLGTGVESKPDAGAIFAATTLSIAGNGQTSFKDFKANGNGGAIYSGGAVTINQTGGTSFTNCAATGSGGAIYSTGAASLENVSFTNCTGNNGGGVYGNSTVSVTNGSFTGCTASTGTGGGIYSGSTFNASDSTFTDCSAKTKGGTIYINGPNSTGRHTISNCTFDGHKDLNADTVNAANGGAIYVNNGWLSLTDSRFSDLTCTTNGGAVYMDGQTSDSLTMEDCIFDGHDTLAANVQNASVGGAVYMDANEGITLKNLTVSDCWTSGDGGGVYAQKAITSTEGTITFTDCYTIGGKGGGAYFNAASAFGKTGTTGNKVIFTRCHDDSTSTSNGGGGAYFNSTLTLQDDTDLSFDSCYAGSYGGGAWFYVATTLDNGTVSFKDCYAGKRGGGAYFVKAATLGNDVAFEKCYTTTAGTSDGGGGAYFTEALTLNAGKTLTCDECYTAANGGGAYFNAAENNTHIKGSLSFENCYSTGGKGGGAYFNNTANLTEAEAATFKGCHADSTNTSYGGGGAWFNGQATLDEAASFEDCYARTNGGGAYFYANVADTLIGVNFTNCKAGWDGTSSVTDGNGGALYKRDGNLTLNGATITDCYASANGGGIYYAPGSDKLILNSTTTISGCTVAENGRGTAIFVASSGKVDFHGGPSDGAAGVSITGNRGAGAVEVNNGSAVLTFDGNVRIKDNYENLTGTDVQKNVVLDYDKNTVIQTSMTGLTSEAYIGVYVTGTNPPTITTDQFYKHGREGAPFGTYGKDGDYRYFINDRLSTPASATAAEKLVRGTAKKATDSTNVMYWEKSSVKLTIDKTVTGAMGDHTKEFSFTLTGLPADMTSVEYKKYSTSDGTSYGTTPTASGSLVVTNGTVLTFTLKHWERIELSGIPSDTEISVTEQTDYYTATFAATIKTGTADQAYVSLTTLPVSATGSSVNGAKWKITEDTTLTVTNNLDAVSPTGITLTYAPYLLMFLFGAMLLIIAHSRKQKGKTER